MKADLKYFLYGVRNKKVSFSKVLNTEARTIWLDTDIVNNCKTSAHDK